MSKWLPIETAPRDGTYVLLFEDLGFGGDSQTMWVARHGVTTNEWFTHDTEYGIYEPTHWMPLPAPPPIDSDVAEA